VNRGAALAGDRVFMVTDDARLIALNRFTGELLWDTVMADYRENYFATSAPLIAGDYVIPGIGGGDSGVRGFLAAFDQRTGKEAWRFWTIPAAGEAGSETWNGKGIAHPGGATWFTGSYDPELKLLYWQVGNPGPDHNGDQREGENLYSDSVVALDVRTGKLKWHYQFTPHDVRLDAQEPLWFCRHCLWSASQADAAGESQWLLLRPRSDQRKAATARQAFANNVTWAKEIAPNGGPSKSRSRSRPRKARRDAPGWATELVVRGLRPLRRAFTTSRRSRAAGSFRREAATGKRDAVSWAAAPGTHLPILRSGFSARSISRRGKLRGSCRRLDPVNRGREHWPPPRGWFSLARIAAP
jgi:alcohol dehydrogenase (cytochrome c)